MQDFFLNCTLMQIEYLPRNIQYTKNYYSPVIFLLYQISTLIHNGYLIHQTEIIISFNWIYIRYSTRLSSETTCWSWHTPEYPIFTPYTHASRRNAPHRLTATHHTYRLANKAALVNMYIHTYILYISLLQYVRMRVCKCVSSTPSSTLHPAIACIRP